MVRELSAFSAPGSDHTACKHEGEDQRKKVGSTAMFSEREHQAPGREGGRGGLPLEFLSLGIFMSSSLSSQGGTSLSSQGVLSRAHQGSGHTSVCLLG